MKRSLLPSNKLILPLTAGAMVLVLAFFLLSRNQNLLQPPLSQTPNQAEKVATGASTPTPDTPEPKIQTLRLFFIALEDNGQKGEQVGCGDSIAPVDVQLPETELPLKAVMQQLLSIKQQTVGHSKLYNSLAQSKLEVKDVSIKNNVAAIYLSGTVGLGGECDNPRFQAQLEKTAKQFSNVGSVQIFINDKPLSEVLSLK